MEKLSIFKYIIDNIFTTINQNFNKCSMEKLDKSRVNESLKKKILNKLELGADDAIPTLLKSDYLSIFTKDELYLICKYKISKFKPSKLLLSFFRNLYFERVFERNSDVYNLYKKAVKHNLLVLDFREKYKILESSDMDVLEKNDLINLFDQFKLLTTKKEFESEKFKVLGTILYELEFSYNIKYSKFELVHFLLVKEEQRLILKIFDTSRYPYVQLDFEADEVRRRTWEEMLYFEFSEGHVVHLELIYDNNSNPKEFYRILRNLKKFKKLINLNLLFFRGFASYYVRNTLLSLTSPKRMMIYEFFHSIPNNSSLNRPNLFEVKRLTGFRFNFDFSRT